MRIVDSRLVISIPTLESYACAFLSGKPTKKKTTKNVPNKDNPMWLSGRSRLTASLYHCLSPSQPWSPKSSPVDISWNEWAERKGNPKTTPNLFVAKTFAKSQDKNTKRVKNAPLAQSSASKAPPATSSLGASRAPARGGRPDADEKSESSGVVGRLPRSATGEMTWIFPTLGRAAKKQSFLQPTKNAQNQQND